jgi:hypothetical protein
MMEVFLVQFLAAGLGAANTALADYSYRKARVSQRTHSLWIATSIAVICLPVLVWACEVFLGAGAFGRTVAVVALGAVFLWVYRNLRQQPPLQSLGKASFPSHPASAAIPPAKFDY